MTLGIKDFSRLLEALIAGPLEERPWEDFLERLRKHADATAVTLMLRAPGSLSPGYMVNAGKNVGAATYREEGFLVDPFVRLPEGKLVSITEIVPEEQLKTSDFYRLFLAPMEAHYVIGADLLTPSGVQASLRLTRGESRGEFTAEERGLCTLLLPHLRQAVEIFVRLDRMRSLGGVYAETLDLLALGAVVVDRGGRVLERNAIADALLAEGDGLIMVRGVLTAAHRSSAARLRNVFEAAARADPEVTALATAISVERSSGRPNLGVVVRPAPHRIDLAEHRVSTLTVFVSDPERSLSPSPATVADLFDLTPTEAALTVLLVSGYTIDQAAARLDVSRNTARTHLRGIFQKTGVSRQSELVSHVLRSVVALAGAP